MNQTNQASPSPRERESSSLEQQPKPSDKEYHLGVRVEDEEPKHTPEKILEREKTIETEKAEPSPDRPDSKKEQIASTSVRPTTGSLKQVAVQPKTELRRNIESILSENIGEAFNSMNDQQKKEFRQGGEEVASKIEQILQQVKVRAKEVVKLIRKWLSLIPGVNKFFLAQEAKIKTDKILALKNRTKGK